MAAGIVQALLSPIYEIGFEDREHSVNTVRVIEPGRYTVIFKHASCMQASSCR